MRNKQNKPVPPPPEPQPATQHWVPLEKLLFPRSTHMGWMKLESVGLVDNLSTAMLLLLLLLNVISVTLTETSLGLEPFWLSWPSFTVQSEGLLELDSKVQIYFNIWLKVTSKSAILFDLFLPREAISRAHDILLRYQRSATNVSTFNLQAGYPWPCTGWCQRTVCVGNSIEIMLSTQHSWRERK